MTTSRTAAKAANLILSCLRATERGGNLPVIPITSMGPVWYAARRKGRVLGSGWLDRPTPGELFSAALSNFGGDPDGQIELCFTYDHRVIKKKKLTEVLANANRGLLGLDIVYGPHARRVAPTQTISSNRSLIKEFRLFLETHGISEEEFHAQGRLTVFSAHQFLVTRGALPRIERLFRGNRIVKSEHVGWGTVEATIDSMASWLLNNLKGDGELTYKYWPSRASESQADNTIRRFMATICLARVAAYRNSSEYRDAARRNLAFNLARFYRDEADYGVIEWQGSAKLGACALAALAILETGTEKIHADIFQRLSRGVMQLWQPNGAFRSFHFPVERNDNQNFYPGEALLFWAILHRRTGDRDLLRRCLQSFEYYREWHRANRNPAFIPWHTQAYTILYQDTGWPYLRDFVFEMNDWLLPMQQWGGRLAPDLWGRFYSPKHPEFGPPHASSTGVYVEGLVDALILAREEGDALRAKSYRTAIWRAIRSLRQLQFADETDCFYIEDRLKVLGGLRTEVYNNEIRVDNVQHGLMGLLKFVTLPGRQNATVEYDGAFIDL